MKMNHGHGHGDGGRRIPVEEVKDVRFWAYADDRAMEDTLYLLDEILEEDGVTAEEYVKRVRQIAKKQFDARLRLANMPSIS